MKKTNKISSGISLPDESSIGLLMECDSVLVVRFGYGFANGYGGVVCDESEVGDCNGS